MARRLCDRDRLYIQKVEIALAKISTGSYGVCEVCEEPIEVKRLEARPVATLCIACKEEQEHKEKVFSLTERQAFEAPQNRK